MKIKNEMLRKIFGASFCAIFAVVFIANIYSVFPIEKAKPLMVLAFALAIVIAGYFAVKLLGTIKITKPKMGEVSFLIIIFAIYALAQGFVAYELETQFTNGWDFGIVATAARDWTLYEMVGGDYFNNWPNNIPIFVFLSGFFELCASAGHFAFSKAGILLNLLLVDFAHLLVYMTVRHIGGRRLGFAALICSMLNPAMMAYSGIYYTDTLTLIFPIAALWLWLYAKENLTQQKHVKASLQIFGIIALLVVGTVLKMTVIILFVAILIDMLMSFDFKKVLIQFCATAAVFILMLVGLNSVVMNAPMVPDENPESYIPKLHWVMMGLHGNGNYYDPDYELTLSVPAEERDEIVKAEIMTRINEYGFGGMMAHLWEKISYTWGDGTYSSCFKIDRDRVRPSSLDRYIKSDGEAFEGYSRYSQGLMAATIFGIALCGVLVFRNKKIGKQLLAPCACVFGLFLFFLAWETRSRYIFNYIPIFTVMAVCAYNELFKLKIPIKQSLTGKTIYRKDT